MDSRTMAGADQHHHQPPTSHLSVALAGCHPREPGTASECCDKPPDAVLFNEQQFCFLISCIET